MIIHHILHAIHSLSSTCTRGPEPLNCPAFDLGVKDCNMRYNPFPSLSCPMNNVLALQGFPAPKDNSNSLTSLRRLLLPPSLLSRVVTYQLDHGRSDVPELC